MSLSSIAPPLLQAQVDPRKPLPALRFYHFFLGPALWYRQPPADAADRAANVPDYRLRADRDDELAHPEKPGDAEASQASSGEEKIYEDPTPQEGLNQKSLLEEEVERKAQDPHPIDGAWIVRSRPLYLSARRTSG